MLHCEEATTVSAMLMSGKGEPLAKMARPLVAAWASAAVHSDLEVGLDRGKMMGGLSFSFMAFRMSSVKRPPQAERPEQLVLEISGIWSLDWTDLSGCSA